MKVRSLILSRVLNFDLDTLIKISFFKSVPKILNVSMLKVKKTLINAERQNNTYKC